jgi:transposase
MRKSRLSQTKQERLIEHFVADATARTAAALVGVNKSTAAYYVHRLREIIYQRTEDETPIAGEVEVDESYFGGRRKGRRGRAAAGKVPVFGLLKRGGKVCAKVIPNPKAGYYRRSWTARSCPTALCIPTRSAPTTCWTDRSSSIIGSTIRREVAPLAWNCQAWHYWPINT